MARMKEIMSENSGSGVTGKGSLSMIRVNTLSLPFYPCLWERQVGFPKSAHSERPRLPHYETMHTAARALFVVVQSLSYVRLFALHGL